MRKKVLYTVFLLAVSWFCVNAQTIKVSNGLSMSSIQTEVFDFFNDNRFAYSGFIGLNYFYRNFFYLSSEIGFASKGGQSTILAHDLTGMHTAYAEWSTSLNYLHLNTTFRARFPMRNFHFYAGIGPKVDFLISNREINFGDGMILWHMRRENPLPPDPPNSIPCIGRYKELVMLKNYTFNRVLFGLKPEIGFSYYFPNRLMLGVNASYHLTMGNIGRNNFLRLDNHEPAHRNLYNRAFFFMFTLGYRL